MNNKRHNKIYFESLARLVLASREHYIPTHSFPSTVTVYLGLVPVPEILMFGDRPAEQEPTLSPVCL